MTSEILTKLFIQHVFLLYVLEIDRSSTSGSCQLWNAALCKPAYQVSVYAEASAELAVDGNSNPDYEGQSCVHTQNAVTGWWMVDLMDEYLVHKIIITTRSGGGSSFREHYVNLFLSDPRLNSSFPLNTDGVLCTSVPEPFTKPTSFNCLSPTYARYVMITRYGGLQFCEMEVMASKKEGNSDCLNPTDVTVSKLFNILRNSVVRVNYDVLDTVLNDNATAHTCLHMCVLNGHLCNGFFWTEDSRDCELLTLNPYLVGSTVVKTGTDFYVEPKIECLGPGIWKLV